MLELILFGVLGSLLAGIPLWLAYNTTKHNQQRRDSPKKRQQARQAELRRKLREHR